MRWLRRGIQGLFPYTTTYSTERSEHFKPCKDKDLAYCLNDGECFVIETLTGSHKHSCGLLTWLPSPSHHRVAGDGLLF
uniref:Uncharacterized protein n=1 Tax=Sphenodon punctatus TaxID=8508 RepID=A0A8D0G535_SPHPU